VQPKSDSDTDEGNAEEDLITAQMIDKYYGADWSLTTGSSYFEQESELCVLTDMNSGNARVTKPKWLV